MRVSLLGWVGSYEDENLVGKEISFLVVLIDHLVNRTLNSRLLRISSQRTNIKLAQGKGI